jgi:hypothetical protein
MVCELETNKHPELDSVRIDPGMYRLDDQSTFVVECPNEAACKGLATHGNDLCAEGYSGPMCQICLVAEKETYVWDDGKCVLCDSGHVVAMYILLAVVLIVLALTAYFIQRNVDKVADAKLELSAKYERFNRQFLTKYKIAVKLLQTLSKITTLYPDITFPAVFTRAFNQMNVFVHLDINVIPFNCVVPGTHHVSFHQKLVAMTLLPLAGITFIGIVYAHQRRNIVASYATAGRNEPATGTLTNAATVKRVDDFLKRRRDEKMGKLEADCIYYALVFVYTIFSSVSTTIMETFNYDGRLAEANGESYLIADYTIQESDPAHRAYVAYAAIMFVVYCIGIPATSFYLLSKHKSEIMQLQTSVVELIGKRDQKKTLERSLALLPVHLSEVPSEVLSEGHVLANSVHSQQQLLTNLAIEIKTLQEKVKNIQVEHPRVRGLAPLYQDYKARYFYFEIIQFAATLFLVALAASLPVDSGSVVFLALMVSTAMLFMLSSWKPYVSGGDDRDATLAQVAISLALCVGMLSLTSPGEANRDWAFGWLLIFFTTVALSAPFWMMLRLGPRLILVVFYNGEVGELPAWIICIYEQGKKAVACARGLTRGGGGCSFCASTVLQSSQTAQEGVEVSEASKTQEPHEWSFQNNMLRGPVSGANSPSHHHHSPLPHTRTQPPPPALFRNGFRTNA